MVGELGLIGAHISRDVVLSLGDFGSHNVLNVLVERSFVIE